MRQLALVQFFTWLGLFCMWLYFPVAVARNVFGAPDESSPLYREGVEWAGVCFAVYSAVCFVFSFVLPPHRAARSGARPPTRSASLRAAAGLLSVAVIHDKYLLLLSMTGRGHRLGQHPLDALRDPRRRAARRERMGVYMGIFNFFIVIPEILASLGFGWVMLHLLGSNRLAAVVAGGVFLLLAAILVLRVDDAAAPARRTGL